jgi:broad specificity phosphatase PhoE
MTELFLVRHAQASFGTENYDRLSDLGRQQSRWLGAYFKSRDMTFDRVITGQLVRHQQTVEEISLGMGQSFEGQAIHTGWNEFAFQALMEAYLEQYPEQIPQDDAPETDFWRLLRSTMLAWAEDRLPAGIPETWEGFENRVNKGLVDSTRDAERGQKILVVSSGGPISMALRQVLDAPASTMIQLNLQIRNSGISHLYFNQTSLQLSGFNHTPHLDQPDRSDSVTYY